jgi:hypothetical protein
MAMVSSAMLGIGAYYGPLPALGKALSASPYCDGSSKFLPMIQTPRSDPILARFRIELDKTDRWREFRHLAEIETDIPAETGAFINAMPFPAGAYRERTPLMHEIRRERIDL